MKIIIGALTILILLTTFALIVMTSQGPPQQLGLTAGAPQVYALSDYQSGFKHGVADAELDNANRSAEDYIHQPGHGMDHHALQFNNGYLYGWCSIQGINSGKETSDADFD